MSDRRAFLRSLASLPLIGGGLALIGNPTAAALPDSDALLYRYVGFLAHEHRAAVTQWEERQAIAAGRPSPRGGYQPAMWWFPHDIAAQRVVETSAPSTRAAVVLSAAGVGLG